MGTIQRPTTHSPITHTGPPYPQNPPTTHLKWPFLHFLMFYTIQTIYFLKAGDTYYPVTHCPLTHHPHRPTIPTGPTHNPPHTTISPRDSVSVHKLQKVLKKKGSTMCFFSHIPKVMTFFYTQMHLKVMTFFY